MSALPTVLVGIDLIGQDAGRDYPSAINNLEGGRGMKFSVRPLSPPISALILLIAWAGQAFSHANLISSVPEANGMAMPPPNELRLKFSEGIELKFTKVKLTGPDESMQ